MKKTDNHTNKLLTESKKIKNDEFFTLLSDIERELPFYKTFLQNKIVYLPCDTFDGEHISNFTNFFIQHFNEYNIKELIVTYYDNNNLSRKLVFNGQTKIITQLQSNGDFQSHECIQLMKYADVIITNPPFSLLQEFIIQLLKLNKQFLIIGNKNIYVNRKLFPYFMNHVIRIGYTHHKGFVKLDGTIDATLPGLSRWLTNFPIQNNIPKPLKPITNYNPSIHQQIDNFNAINVDKVKEIPNDYYDIMAVPITYIDKENQELFEIIGNSYPEHATNITRTKIYTEQDYGKQYGVLNHGCTIIDNETKQLKPLYARLFIKRKNSET